MTSGEIEKHLNSAISDFLNRDIYLLEINANERSISHRLAVYLEHYFTNWEIDCEYNRNHDDTKRLELADRHTNDTDLNAVTVYPDIIVHRRATDENLLVIEMKKSNSNEDIEYDLIKLKGYKNELRYKCAVFLLFSVAGNNPGVERLEFI